MATYLEIQEQIRLLQAQAEELKKVEFDSILAEVKLKIEQYGITAKDLGFATATPVATVAAIKNSKGEVAPKYQSQAGDKTWSGRGRKPLWVQEHLDNGGNLEDLLISK